MGNIKYLLTIMAPVRKLMLLAAVLSFLTVASNTLLLALAAYLIAAAALHPPLAALMAAITGVRFFGLSRAFFRYGERYFSHKATFQILTKIRLWFYCKIEPLAPGRLLTVKSGDLLARIMSDVDTLQFFYLRVIAPPAVAFLILVFTSYWLAAFSKNLVLILITAFFISGMVIPFIFRQKFRDFADKKISGHNFLKNTCVDALKGLPELASAGNSAWQVDKLCKEALSYENHNLRLSILTARCESLKNLALNTTLIVLLFSASQLALDDVFERVLLAVVVIAVEGCFEAVGPLSLVIISLDEARLSLRRLLNITSDDSPVQKESRKVSGIVPAKFNLRVSNLSFSYENSAHAALSNISFELKEGSHLAIVGASGAGKSTLVNLLCKFFDYSAGSINFCGRELLEYAADDLRRYLAVVSQSSYLFNFPVKDNILLAKPSATPVELEVALHNAGLEEYLSDKSLLGKQGALLSGGERQRVALARAFLKDAPLLIFDEPTASLDAVNARKLMESIYKLAKNRSSILITHDLSLLGNVDEIILLDQGSILEQGTLKSLLAQNGLFAKMYLMHNELAKW